MTTKWIEKPLRQRNLNLLNASQRFFVKYAAIFRPVDIMEYIPVMVAVGFLCEACEEIWCILAKEMETVSWIKSEGINARLAASKNVSMLK